MLSDDSNEARKENDSYLEIKFSSPGENISFKYNFIKTDKPRFIELNKWLESAGVIRHANYFQEVEKDLFYANSKIKRALEILKSLTDSKSKIVGDLSTYLQTIITSLEHRLPPD